MHCALTDRYLQLNNIAVVVVCICVIVIATYIFIFKIKKLKADERTNQKILQGFKDIANTNVNDIKIHKKDDKLSISMNVQNKEENFQPPNNMYAIKGRKEEINISKEIKSI